MATEIYRVRSGESLSIIARDMLNDKERWPEIAFMNGISHPYFIYPGQILELPPENGGIVVEVVGTKRDASQTAAASVEQQAAFSFSPATVILLAIGAALFLTRSK